ncbi:hypothetical protein GY45DRAFT_1237863 [Cubamyces sp. BRFM 1775]|nr:hypothetical protein GY45DRAFT_1237863 [Cubamyces sp. BRFM 1775]
MDYTTTKSVCTILCYAFIDNCFLSSVFWAFVVSLLKRDWFVSGACVLSIITLAFQPLAGALFTVRDTWWTRDDSMVNSLYKIGLNGQGNFTDMTAFQAASSYASANIIYEIGSPPFISGGYTVGAFDVSQDTNSTILVNTTAILSQVSCINPDSLAMVNEESTPLVWHNTALFGHCEYTWTMDSNATYFFGVVPADFADCNQDYTNIPVQFRPVLFWFFMYGSQPIASVVLCYPHATAQPVSVEFNTITNTISVMPLQSAPDGSADVPNIGPFPYNGLFFDELNLDSTALARLSAIQQQLPGAVFEAAKARDPLLLTTFTNYGFTSLVQDAYTMYLSIIAKSIYFVEEQEPLTVRISTYCKRLFIVRTAAILLSSVMTFLALCGCVLVCVHRMESQGVPIPPKLGTLSAAIWLTARTDVATALSDEDVTPDRISAMLAGYRYFILPESGRIVSVVDTSRPSGTTGRWWSVPYQWRRLCTWTGLRRDPVELV